MSMKQIVILSGSPRTPGKSASDLLSKTAAEQFQLEGAQPRVISVRRTLSRKHTEQAFAEMAAADALLIVFPLYIFCLPGILMRFLQLYKAYADGHPEAKKDVPIYAVVNCGFPEPHINGEAVRVIGRFAAAVGGHFRFGVMIGGGGMYNYPAPQVRRKLEEYRAAIRRIGADLAAGSRENAENILIKAPVGRRLYYTMGNLGWKLQARKNGKKKADLYAKPYQPAEKP